MSPRTREQFDAMKDAARERILDAALVLFARKGLAAAGVTEIAREAGVSLGLLYHYYASKEEMFASLIRKAIAAAGEALQSAVLRTVGAADGIRAISRLAAGALKGDSKTAYFFLLLVQASLAEPEGETGNASCLRGAGAPFELLSGLIQRGQAQGMVKSGNPMQLAQLYWAAFQGMCLYKITMRGFFPPEPEQLDGILLL